MITLNVMSVETADLVIEMLDIIDQVEDYEFNELGHVYTLIDGSAVVITTLNDFEIIAWPSYERENE